MYLAALFSEFPTLKIKLFLNVSIVFFISNDFFLRFSISIGILSKLEGKIILPILSLILISIGISEIFL